MIEPRIDRLLSHTATDADPPSRYALVIMAAKRARQINNYHHQLGEGLGLEDAPPPGQADVRVRRAGVLAGQREAGTMCPWPGSWLE
jgi:DNA-directed RNA polymerase omega subunit